LAFLAGARFSPGGQAPWLPTGAGAVNGAFRIGYVVFVCFAARTIHNIVSYDVDRSFI
jgi:hypothetical protein